MHQIYCDIEYKNHKYYRLKCIVTDLQTRSDTTIYFKNGHISVDMVDMYKYYFELPLVVKILLSDKFNEFVENDIFYKWININFDIIVPRIVQNRNDLMVFYNKFKKNF